MFIIPLQLPHGALAPPSGFDDRLMPAHPGKIVRFGRCELRTARRELLVDGAPRPLQPRPFDLLVYLVENGDRVVTRKELLARVWNDASVQPCSLPAAILRLRRALGSAHQEAVRTYQRVGYRFIAPAASVPS
jgi:DNA-binding winged helix-turn-helix (wHTH) protein